jgi:ribose transport system substrate-binding protein
LTQIDDQIAAGVDGFVISPNNSEEIVPGIERLNAEGIPVVTVDAIAAGGEVASHVGFDNEAAGADAAQYLIDTVKGGGDVLELTGAQGAYHAVRRGEGFNKAMAGDSAFKVISRDAEWTADKALSLTVDNFTADPGIKAVYSHNDEMVRGIVSGLDQVGKKPGSQVTIVGIDGTPQALDRIRAGEQNATIQQDPFDMGSLAVSTLIDVLNEEQVPKEQLLKPLLITKENVDDSKLWGNEFKP